MRINNPKTGQIQSNTICGRRFCRLCGRWKHTLYFPPRRHRNGREYPQSECGGCRNRVSKRSRKEATGDRRLRRQEYERIYHEVQRRRRGIPARPLRAHGDTSYGARVPVVPALVFIEDWIGKQRNDQDFRKATGVNDRTLRAWRSGKRETARFNVMDAVLTGIGRPDLVAVLYGSES